MAFPFAAIATLGAAALALKGQRSANQANAKMAQNQMDFQERMSSTAYQRSRDDMRKAGLNPILTFTHGGASTPSGAMSSSLSEQGAGLSSAMDARRLYAEIQNLKEMNKKIASDTQLNKALRKAALADTELKSNSARNIDLASEKLGMENKIFKDVNLGIDAIKDLRLELQKSKFNFKEHLENMYKRVKK